VKNIAANAWVGLRLGRTWHHGTATLLDDDDPRARLRQLPRINSLLVRLWGTDLLTIRIDLDRGGDRRGASVGSASTVLGRPLVDDIKRVATRPVRPPRHPSLSIKRRA